MQNRQLASTLAVALTLAGVAGAQSNDNCANALPLPVGTTCFDTTNATTGPPPWPPLCTTGGGNDLWYTYVSTGINSVRIDTCTGTSFDTVLQVFEGVCGGLTAIGCNDDFPGCPPFSRVVFDTPASGIIYTIRVGGAMGATGTGCMTVSERPRWRTCLEIPDFGQGVVVCDLHITYGGAGLMNRATVTMDPGSDADISVSGGDTVDVIWTPPNCPMVAGDIVCFDFAADPGANVSLLSGYWTDENGMNIGPVDLNIVMLCPPGTFDPIGANYCTPAVPNSTGQFATMSATGSLMVNDNHVDLFASDLPANQFGYFLVSQTQGFFTPPGSSGPICLGGSIGRYPQPQDVIQGPTGRLRIDLNSIPVNPPQAVLPGDTWNFQCWYRDTGNTSNFTDGIEFLFQ